LRVWFLLQSAVDDFVCLSRPEGDKAALSGLVQFLVLVNLLVFCGFGKNLFFLIHFFCNRGFRRRGIKEAESLRRFRLGSLDRLHGRNGFRRLFFRRLLLRRQRPRTRFGLCGLPGGVHLGLRSLKRALELQVSGGEINDGRWQVPVKFFGGGGELEGRGQRGVLSILQLLRDDVDTDLVVFERSLSGVPKFRHLLETMS
jgi:hypothetical protein